MKICKRFNMTSAEVVSNQSVPKVNMVDQPGGNISTTTVFDIREPLLDETSLNFEH